MLYYVRGLLRTTESAEYIKYVLGHQRLGAASESKFPLVPHTMLEPVTPVRPRVKHASTPLKVTSAAKPAYTTARSPAGASKLQCGATASPQGERAASAHETRIRQADQSFHSRCNLQSRPRWLPCARNATNNANTQHRLYQTTQEVDQTRTCSVPLQVVVWTRRARSRASLPRQQVQNRPGPPHDRTTCCCSGAARA